MRRRQRGFLLNPFRFGESWVTVDSWTEGINSTPWANYTHRLRVYAARFPDANTTLIRLTYKAHPSGAGAQTTKVYVGLGATSGDEYDFDGAPTEVLFGGSSGFSISAGSIITSDATALVMDGTRDVLISGQSASTPACAFAGFDNRTNWKCWYKTGADAATENASGYTANLVEAVGVVKIEVR